MNTITIKPKRQRGASLPITLMLLIPMTLLAISVAKRNNLEELMAASQRDGQQSLMNAESGLALAEEVLDQIDADTFGQSLGNILASNGDIGVNQFALTEGTVTAVLSDNYESAEDINPGFQNPFVDVDGRLLVTSTGTYQGGERVVQAIYFLPSLVAVAGGLPPLAIFAQDTLTISGNPFVWGDNANIHSNNNVDISGSPEIWGLVSAGGDVDIWGDAVNQDGDPVDYVSGAAQIETPYVYPPAYKPYATYYLTANCAVYDGWPINTHTRIIQNVKDNGPWNGWDCDYNTEWVLGNDTIDGFYYVEGNVGISGNPGEGTTAVSISIVAEGYIEVSGNPNIQPYYSTAFDINDPEVQALIGTRENVLLTNEVLFLAGNDLKINGNAEQHFNGVMAAHMEFDISGAPVLEGAVIAENGRAQAAQGLGRGQEITAGRDVKNMADWNWIGGDPSIIGITDPSGSGGTPPVGTGAVLEAWREVIN